MRGVSKYFPLPKFLKPAHIGVSFSDINIKAIKFDRESSGHNLQSVIAPLPDGSIVSGDIINMENVLKSLLVIRSEFSSPFVFFTIPDELAYVFSVSIPILHGGNVAESVAFTMEENVPIPIIDTVFDFTVTKITQSKSGYDASFVVAACVKNKVAKFIDAFQKSGFEVVGALHESQAIANALVPQGLLGTFAIIHARENRVGIYLVRDRVIHFSTIRSVSDSDYSKDFLDEYKKFLEYSSKYDTSGEPTQSVFVCGEFDYAKKIVESLVDSGMHIENIKLANVWSNVLKIEKEIPSITYEDSLNLAGPVGAVLADID